MSDSPSKTLAERVADPSRVAYERWVTAHDGARELGRRHDGEYENHDVACEWMAWNAAWITFAKAMRQQGAQAWADRIRLMDLASEVGGEQLTNERAAEIETEMKRIANICDYCHGTGRDGDEAAFPEPAREFDCHRCNGKGTAR